jgi:hypothetical protein
MSQKRYQVKALQQRQFRAPVKIMLPSDQVSDKGEAQYDALNVVVLFRSVPADEARTNLRRIQELRDSEASMAEVLEESVRQTQSYVIGIEKHPEHDWPFMTDSGADAQISTEDITQLLQVREIRDAIEKVYSAARSGELLTKNSKT